LKVAQGLGVDGLGQNPPTALCSPVIPPISIGQPKEDHMKGIIAWFMGVPLFVIILLYVFGYF
jgi:hypothetical protein